MHASSHSCYTLMESKQQAQPTAISAGRGPLLTKEHNRSVGPFPFWLWAISFSIRSPVVFLLYSNLGHSCIGPAAAAAARLALRLLLLS